MTNNYHKGLGNAAKKALTAEQRFWPKVNKTDSCWEWTGAKSSDGYGSLNTANGCSTSAHRLSWTIHFGDIPTKRSVLHKCDNPSCVNPTHLFLGTQLDNVRDCMIKQRNNPPKGERSHLAKLTETAVISLRKEYAKVPFNIKDRARKLGLYPMTLYYVIWRKTWKHV